jgi:hypothetical protein
MEEYRNEFGQTVGATLPTRFSDRRNWKAPFALRPQTPTAGVDDE